MCNTKIIKALQDFRSATAWLKKNSPIYPRIFTACFENENPLMDADFTKYLSTLVRIEREGKYYLVHCVESCVFEKGYEVPLMESIYQKMMLSAYNIQHLYMIGSNMEDVDPDQTPEPERLKKLIYPFK